MDKNQIPQCSSQRNLFNSLTFFLKISITINFRWECLKLGTMINDDCPSEKEIEEKDKRNLFDSYGASLISSLERDERESKERWTGGVGGRGRRGDFLFSIWFLHFFFSFFFVAMGGWREMEGRNEWQKHHIHHFKANLSKFTDGTVSLINRVKLNEVLWLKKHWGLFEKKLKAQGG